MTDIDDLLARNAAFAAHATVGDLVINPSGNLMIVGCVDPRVDPTHILGLALGEAAVIRNVGGRITPQTLRDMAMLAEVGAANKDARPPGDWNLVVLHHTDCGMTDLAAFPDQLADYFGIAATDLDAKAASDPWRSVQVDVDVLHANLLGGSTFFVSGIVYDVETGLVHTVAPPTALSHR